jgi:hypothetical protein
MPPAARRDLHLDRLEFVVGMNALVMHHAARGQRRIYTDVKPLEQHFRRDANA